MQLDDDALPGGNAGGVGDVDPDTANTSGTLAHSYGADGAGTTLLTTAGSVLPAGFTAAVSNGGQTLTISQGATAVLRIQLTNTTSGAYTVTQLAAIDHPVAGTEDNLQFTVNYVATDGDGDTATGSLSIDVDDDTPTIGTTGASPTLIVDETNLVANASAGFATAFTPSFGADGAGTVGYALGVVAGPSGLVDTATGEAVNLVLNGTVVEGRTETTDALVFTVSVTAAGCCDAQPDTCGGASRYDQSGRCGDAVCGQSDNADGDGHGRGRRQRLCGPQHRSKPELRG